MWSLASVARAPLPALYRVMSTEEWMLMRRQGYFLGNPKELKAGFLHLSPIDQVETTAWKHFANEEIFWLLSLKLSSLNHRRLVWTTVPNRGNSLFGHLYGPLPIKAVRSAHMLHWQQVNKFD